MIKTAKNVKIIKDRGSIVSANVEYLFFISDRNGTSDIYLASAKQIFKTEPE